MTWFLQPRDPAAMPPLPGDLPSAGEQFAEGARNEYLAIDSWAMGERAANDLRQEMLGALGGFEAIGPTLSPEERPLMRSPETMTEVLLSRIAALPVGNFPKSREEFDAEVIRRRNIERDESDAMLARGDAPITQFAGRMAGAMTDPASIMTLFLGGEVQIGRLGRFVMAETGAGAVGEVPAVIQERQVARDLGRPEPDTLDAALQIGLGAAGGGALGGAIAGGARLLDYIRIRREGEIDAAGDRPPLEHEADIDAAERALRRGEEPPATQRVNDPPPGLPGDPPGWDQIRNGIFAGESGGDYDALFGYQNRTGGEFANVRLTEMTVDQAIQFSDPSGPYAQWVKARIGRVATPMGAYQIVGRTLREAKAALGLRGDEVMTRELQDELGKWIYRTQGTGAWVGYKGPRRSFVPSEGEAPVMSTARGFTRSGQVAADDIRVDVTYEVVDASVLRRASGDLQPRDRSRAASDEQIAEIAARLDPARLLPSPEADRGAPIVAPDGTIESGNARVAAIERAYDMGLDRAGAYRQAIEEFTGEAIPEGVERPVLISRRTSDFPDEGTRQRFTRAANRATTARMSATEQARADAADIAPRAFDAYRPGARLNGPENREFVRRFMSGLPQAERAALVTRDGRLNIDGLRRIRQALFARAFDAEDLLQLVAETENPAVESLLRMLEDLAPDWASFRTMIEAGYIRPDFDITAALMDAVRVIAHTRSDARDGQSVIAAIRDALSQSDMFASRDPMVEAIIDVFYKGDRARRPEASGEILARYIAEAAIVGRADIGDLSGEAVTPNAALTRAIEGHETKADFRLPGAGEAPSVPEFDVSGIDGTGYGDGVTDPAVGRADDAIETELRENISVAFPPELDDVAPGDYVRTLAEAQPFDDLDTAYRLAAAAQERIARAGDEIAEELGVRFEDPGLKNRADAEEKLARKSYDDPRRLTDVSRGGFVIASLDQASAVADALAARFDVVDEGWLRQPTGYVDYKVIVRHPDGMLSEVQIWTEAMFDAKKPGTALYDEWRKLPDGDPRRAVLLREQVDLYSAAAGTDFDVAMFRADGMSSDPKFRSNSASKASRVETARDVNQTSPASTSDQDAPGSSLARANNSPSSRNNTAGRPSQLQNVSSFMGENPLQDTPNMGAFGDEVNSIREIYRDFARAELPIGDGETVTVREMLDEIDRDRGLAELLETCRLGSKRQ